MSQQKQLVNQFLVNIFNDILRIEEKSLKTGELSDLYVTELHILDTIGLDQKRTMTEVASDLKITLGTLTTAINKLIKKGYVERTRTEKDRRIVLISLTEKGQHAYQVHEQFHLEMVDNAVSQLEAKEVEALVSSLGKIDSFFREKYRS